MSILPPFPLLLSTASQGKPATSTIEIGLAHHDHRKPGGKRYWLDSKRNVARIFHALIAANVLWLAADFFYAKKPEFEALGGWADGGFGFYPVYGFVGAFALVLAAKQMRRILMRPEDYYERRRGGRSSS